MPFQSEAQRKLLWAKHPDIAKAWAHGKHTGKDHKAAVKRRLKDSAAEEKKEGKKKDNAKEEKKEKK